MRTVHSKNTSPELFVRSLIHHLGFRYRLYRDDLPGKPDLVFPGKNKVIFIHGCFWHGHACKRGRRTPKSNQDYWIAKIEGNRKRDKDNAKSLKKLGWEVLTIWECEIKDINMLMLKIVVFLD